MDTVGFAHPPRNVAALGIGPGMAVADFGSGSGAYVLLLAEKLQNSGVVYAVDIQKDLLRRIHNEAQKRGFTTVKVLWGDIEKQEGSKLGNKLLDLVLVSNLLFQVEDKVAVLRETFRVLRSGGRAVVIDWSDSFGGMGPTQDAVFTKEAALQAARGAGFELASEFEAGAHHYGIVLRKP